MTEIVGILNVTPDSFSDGGQFTNPPQATERVKQMFEEGADIIDIGAESTRPGAVEVRVEEEWTRLEPLLNQLAHYYPAHRFSIDTRHPEIARRIAKLWSADVMINDVTGLSDPDMVDVVATCKLKVIMSHLPKEAQGNIEKAHQQKITNEEQVREELLEKFSEVQAAGIRAEKIVLDPGIGFGKSPELNRRLLGFAALVPHIPVMIGYSRKRFLGESCMSAETNLRAGRIAIAAGAQYLRVHDVSSHLQLTA